MNKKCSVKRGFFILRECGKIAVQHCPDCNRDICNQHCSVLDGRVLCVECKARQTEQQRGTHTRTRTYTTHDDYWPYWYRHHYYSYYDYNPLYHADYYDSYYDQYDVRSFHKEHQHEAEHHDEPSAPNLLDS